MSSKWSQRLPSQKKLPNCHKTPGPGLSPNAQPFFSDGTTAIILAKLVTNLAAQLVAKQYTVQIRNSTLNLRAWNGTVFNEQDPLYSLHINIGVAADYKTLEYHLKWYVGASNYWSQDAMLIPIEPRRPITYKRGERVAAGPGNYVQELLIITI
jgi:hypothetical protein